MAEQPDHSDVLAPLIDRLVSGDEKAIDDVITHSMERLRRLARKMLRAKPQVRMRHETDDVLQNASLRLYRALKDVKPSSTREFFGLAAVQIRRELIDLARHDYGPEGSAAHQAQDLQSEDSKGKQRPIVESRADSGSGPVTRAQRREQDQEIHDHVQNLPEAEREVFDLHFYQGLTLAAVAKLVGVSEPTMKRRWRSARLLLHDVAKGSNRNQG